MVVKFKMAAAAILENRLVLLWFDAVLNTVSMISNPLMVPEIKQIMIRSLR